MMQRPPALLPVLGKLSAAAGACSLLDQREGKGQMCHGREEGRGY